MVTADVNSGALTDVAGGATGRRRIANRSRVSAAMTWWQIAFVMVPASLALLLFLALIARYIVLPIVLPILTGLLRLFGFRVEEPKWLFPEQLDPEDSRWDDY
jgi:hypothetical protein